MSMLVLWSYFLFTYICGSTLCVLWFYTLRLFVRGCVRTLLLTYIDKKTQTPYNMQIVKTRTRHQLQLLESH